METRELLQRHRTEILRIAKKHGVSRIRVFGSVARGDATEESDVDFVIESGPERTPWFPGGLIADLEELLGRKVDVVEESAQLHPLVRQEILNDVVPI